LQLGAGNRLTRPVDQVADERVFLSHAGAYVRPQLGDLTTNVTPAAVAPNDPGDRALPPHADAQCRRATQWQLK
jgi:hypothetical protein